MSASLISSNPAPVDATRADLQARALAWWGAHGRRLNFRRTRHPYAVLVSEVIAQQTQIARVEAAWAAFMDRFPTVEALAAASSADVLRQWRGLGYNRRALNLWRAARVLMAEYDGKLPADVELLARLPGVGPYTARAVAAIAFGQRVAAVDTNVRRVVGRALLGEAEAPAGPELQRTADDLVPDGRAGEWTHALMDIGALFCRPRNPRCEECPLAAECRYRTERATAVAGSDAVATGRGRAPGVRPGPSFPQTSRWLRGRLLDLARATPDGEWFPLPRALGSHDGDAVATAVRAMAAEGLLELDTVRTGLARLPQ